MITIVADPHSYHSQPPGALCGRGARDYVRIRSAIRMALDQGHNLSVYVTDRLLLHWLGDFRDYDEIKWEDIVPEADYRRLFGHDPVLPFTPELLIALDIANINAPQRGIEVDSVSWILGERLHTLWAIPQGSPAHLAQLLAWILTYHDRLVPHLAPIVQHRLAAWSDDYTAYQALRAGSLMSDAINLVRHAALQRYDTEWLHKYGLAELPLVTLELERTHWAAALQEVETAIERYWREHITQSLPNAQFVQVMLERMSGWSSAELRAAEELFRRDASLLDPSLLQIMRRRFTQLPQASAVIDDLETLIPPEQPVLPQEQWSDEEWLRWATHDYMPYFVWTVRTNQPRDHQQACAHAYEIWLMQRYPYWLTVVGSPLITHQFTLMRDLLNAQSNTVVIWLVVDGMAWWQGRILQEICRHHALYLQRYEAGVAMLPSLTNISKRALVTGMAVTEAPRVSIAQAAREKLERAGVRSYVSHDAREALEALRSSMPPQCLVWFANSLDRLAHDRPDVADDTMVRGYLEDLARNLARMQAICTERGLAFHVLVGSDHGSTLLPPGAPTRQLLQAAREVVDVWEDVADQRIVDQVSGRAAVVSDARQLHIEQPDHWHHLARLPFQLPQDYLVPCGYATIGRRPSGWTHGGLSPEETVVPLMHMAPEALVVQALSITMQGQLRSRQAGVLDLVLVNPNLAPLEKARIQVADLPPISIERVAAAGRYETSIALPARDIEGTELSVHWELEGSVLGVTHRQQGEARITVRRLQVEDSFDDLFG